MIGRDLTHLQMAERRNNVTLEVRAVTLQACARSHLGDLRARVGEATFEHEWERGRAMTLLEAIDQASDEQRELESHTL